LPPRNKKSGGQRQLHQRVKSAKGRKLSSTLWLQRQLNDPYVAAAKAAGYRSRAAYKLEEMDDRFHFLGRRKRVLDLGAAPGAWTQVNLARCKDGAVIAVDINEMDQIAGADVLKMDVYAEDAVERLREVIGEPVDVVQSDMAAPATGHPQTDHLRIMGLCEAALDLAVHFLAPGGTFVAKVLQGGAEGDLLNRMKREFKTVKHFKPKSSRSGSAEMYVVAMGFRPSRPPDGDAL
jgi:23S rRNA (uridine2552-2'-O)-methyltransferase